MCITLSLVATVTFTFVRSKGAACTDPIANVPFASSGFDASADFGGGAGGVTGTGVPGGGGGGRYRSKSSVSTVRSNLTASLLRSTARSPFKCVSSKVASSFSKRTACLPYEKSPDADTSDKAFASRVFGIVTPSRSSHSRTTSGASFTLPVAAGASTMAVAFTLPSTIAPAAFTSYAGALKVCALRLTSTAGAVTLKRSGLSSPGRVTTPWKLSAATEYFSASVSAVKLKRKSRL